MLLPLTRGNLGYRVLDKQGCNLVDDGNILQGEAFDRAVGKTDDFAGVARARRSDMIDENIAGSQEVRWDRPAKRWDGLLSHGVPTET